MTPRFETCSIRHGSRIHLVKQHLTVVPEGVETYCGQRALPRVADPNGACCRKCVAAANDEINGVTA